MSTPPKLIASIFPKDGISDAFLQGLAEKYDVFPYDKIKNLPSVHIGKGNGRCECCHDRKSVHTKSECKPCTSFSTCPTYYQKGHEAYVEEHKKWKETRNAQKKIFDLLVKGRKKRVREENQEKKRIAEEKKAKQKKEKENWQMNVISPKFKSECAEIPVEE